MPINSTKQTVNVTVDPYSSIAELVALSGNPVQAYDKYNSEYTPDRSLVPCVLMPKVSVSDPEGVMSGEQTVVEANWYLGTPKSDASNLITNQAGYEVSASGKPTLSLTITKNIPPDESVEIYCVFKITDKRRAKQDSFEASMVLRSTLFTTNNYTLKIDQPTTYTVNPLTVVPDEKKCWAQTLNAQLYDDLYPVADEQAAYWWQMMGDDGSWRDFTADELETMVISGKDSSTGYWTKQLKLDARFFSTIAVRCRAAYYEEGSQRPSIPESDQLTQTVGINVEMPKTLEVKVLQTSGARMDNELKTPVSYEVRILYNKNEIDEDKYSLFNVMWYGTSVKTGSTETYLGTGKEITFTPSTFGFPVKYGINVQAKVYLYSVMALSKDSDGKVIRDADGALIGINQFI